jgi:hypothetical protein
MANVFPGREVAHVWNSQSQPEGRNNNGQFYFTGRRLYSYGSHYLVGFIMPDGVALLNASGYSITTSKHKGFASYATCNRTTYSVPNLTELDYALRALADGNGRRNQRSVREYLGKHAAELSEEAGAYIAGVFGLLRSWPAIKRKAERDAIKAKREAARRNHSQALALAKRFADMSAESFALAIPDESGRDVVSGNYTESLASFTKKLAAAHKAASAAGQTRRKAILWERLKALRSFNAAGFGGSTMRPDAAAIAAERERRRLEAEREAAERRADWLAGKGNGRFTDDNGGALLRIRGDLAEPETAELETSHGARVPLLHAIKVFRFVKLVRESAGHWQRNGRTVRVGHYQLDSIDPDGFNAGCHRINWPEIERVAKLAGVFNLPADDAAAVPSADAA